MSAARRRLFDVRAARITSSADPAIRTFELLDHVAVIASAIVGE
jgi:hypothetical protein